MSMLAEKREKKRYNLQPRGKALYEDSNRFGTRMLEKMGWSKGKGLGANETGNKEFVRVKYKSDSIGLGFEERDDQWTQHDNDFNGLLRSLNGSEQNSSAEEDFIPKATGFGFQVEEKGQGEFSQISGESLEEKSKKSKARVHYQKFTRGKDISRYSEKDLANIFGKKSLKVEKVIEKQLEEDVEKKENHDSFGVIIVNAETSIHDYFKNKMAKKKKIEEEQPEGYNQTGLDEEIVNFEEGKPKKKKKVKILPESNPDKELDKPYKNKAKSINKKNGSESNFNNPSYSEHKDVDDADDVTESANYFGQDEKNKEKYSRDMALCEATEDEEKRGNVRTVYKKKKRQDKIEKTRENQQDETLTECQENVKTESKKRKMRYKLEETRETEQDGTLIKDEGSVVKLVFKEGKTQDKIKETHENEQDGALIEKKANVKTAPKKRKVKNEEMGLSHKNEQVGDLAQDKECSVSRKKKKKNIRTHHANDKELFHDEKNAYDIETSENNVLNSKEELKQKNEGESVPRSEYKKEMLAASAEVRCGVFEENSEPAFHPNEAIMLLEDLKPKSKSKKDKNQKDKNQVESASNNNINSVDTIKDSENYCVFQLSGYHAEIFRYINVGSFEGSNFSEIIGYGLTKNIKLEITSKRMDTEKIQNMWSKVLNKYTYKRKHNFKIKAAKKQNVFKVL